MIILKNINKYYNSGTEKYHALKDINLTFPDKGLVFIVGKSGSGKSTLLNIIGGIDSYDSGELTIDNLNTKDFRKKDFNAYRNSYVGFIFQEFNVVKNLTVYENIALALELQHEDVKKQHDWLIETIKMVGLEGKENRKMNQLSGGERQRVAIARAIVKKPKVIIADEPTGNLDKHNRDIVMDILKKLSLDQLVIVVTHDKILSTKYSDMEITLKDGSIIDNTIKESNNTQNGQTTAIKAVQPSLKTSLFLSFKSIKQNLMRFIFIILFFTISLVFANTTINLYFSNATSKYATFQADNHNKYITLSQNRTIYKQDIKTGFYQLDTLAFNDLLDEFNDNEADNYHIYKTIKNEIKINQNSTEDLSPLYMPSIDNIIIIDDRQAFEENYHVTMIPSGGNIKCLITDYVAEALIHYDYFGDGGNPDNLPLDEYLWGRYLTSDSLNYPIYFEGIIETDFSFFKNKDLEGNPNLFASYFDNLNFYNAIFIDTWRYVANADSSNNFVSTSNIKYTYDDFVYYAFNNEGIINNVVVTYFNPNTDLDKLIKGQAPKQKLEEEDYEQVVVSTGFLKQICDYTVNQLEINLEYGSYLDIGIIDPNNGYTAIFNLYGYKRILSSLSFNAVGIIEDETPTLYFCNPTETQMYYNYLKTSYSDYDNYLTIEISDDQNTNASLYQTLRDRNIVIDNLSYIKLQVVNDFIDNNLIMFLGLFFALLMFSVLMIFNFVVITIKNSTKDIGIFMSLGMNGFKIACIYLFQIILISLIAFIISTIGAIIFLYLLDFNLGKDASVLINQYFNLNLSPINFKTFNISFSGILISFGIAFVVPLVSIIIPLINLAAKRPIDVLKVS